MCDPSAILHFFDKAPACLLAFALPRAKLPLARRTLPGFPSRQLLQLLMSLSVQEPRGQLQSTKERHRLELAGEDMVEFLVASQFAKSLRDMPKAGAIWLKIVQRRNPDYKLEMPILPSSDVQPLEFP